MSDEEMEKLPTRSALGDRPKVGKLTAIRTFVSGLVTDLRGLWQRVRRR